MDGRGFPLLGGLFYFRVNPKLLDYSVTPEIPALTGASLYYKSFGPFLVHLPPNRFRMKKITLFVCIAGALLGSTGLSAQEKKFLVGYVNLEAVLAYMPEMRTVNTTISTFQTKLEEDLQTRQNYLQTKYEEYVQLANSGASQESLKPMEAELQKLDEEVKRKAAEAEEKLMTKRQELMGPISDRIQAELKAMATEEGLDMVLNSVDGTGNSIVLFSATEKEMTEVLLKRLGVEVPKPAEAPAPK